VPDTSFDLIVVGSGVAGLSAALRAAELGSSVAVLTAGALLAGSSPRAQGGVAAAVGADDAPSLHASDTFKVGAGLNDARAVSVLTSSAPQSVGSWRDVFADDLGLEAGHARRRILHAGGGATGQVLTRALLERARRQSRISFYEHTPVTSLIIVNRQVRGVIASKGPTPFGSREGCLEEDSSHSGAKPHVMCPREGSVAEISAGAVLLATGGYAALWGRSTNAPETRGSGLWLAWHAGASLADLEFVQFHPTALSIPGKPSLLLSEALRGEGALLLDEHDQPIVDPLLPRDVVARALQRHAAAGHQAFLSLRHLNPDHVHAHFESLAHAVLRASGLDLARDRLPVAPAAHYCMGGIRTDTWGRTDVPGLYAAGEVACSGAQGANRLASNSLLECLVFGARTAEAALTDATGSAATWTTRALADTSSIARHAVVPAIAPQALRARLDVDLGVERAGKQLAALAAELPEPDVAPNSDLLVASLAANAALLRQESRGAHYRTDFPHSDPAWRGRLHWRRANHFRPVFEEVSS
jgi:L-aspartate oxidase